MSTPVFLACALLIAGLCGLLMWYMRRRVVAAGRALPPLPGRQIALMLALAVLLGAMLIKLLCDIFIAAPLPGWANLIFPAMVAAAGLSNLFDDTPDRTRFPSRRLLGIALLLFGAAALTIEGYKYATSLGTTGIVSR